MAFFPQNNADKLYRKLVHLRSENQTRQRYQRAGFMGLFGRKVDLLDHYEKKLEDMEDNMRTEQSSAVIQVTPVFDFDLYFFGG